jgi:hypothetical protein
MEWLIRIRKTLKLMKIKITKLDAAKSQTLEAINLFFEERDPVSIHTLAGAALQILHDHFKTKKEVGKAKLILHYETPYIKNEHRKYWSNKVREAKNFFKHANKDLKKTINFETDTNAFHLLEAIMCFISLKDDFFVWPIEFNVFLSWVMLKYPKNFNDNDMIEKCPNINPENLDFFRKAICLLNKQTNMLVPQCNRRT